MKVNEKSIDMCQLIKLISANNHPHTIKVHIKNGVFNFHLTPVDEDDPEQYINDDGQTLAGLFYVCNCSLQDIIHATITYEEPEFNDFECEMIESISDAYYPSATKFKIHDCTITYSNDKCNLGHVSFYNDPMILNPPCKLSKHGNGWYSLSTFDEVTNE